MSEQLDIDYTRRNKNSRKLADSERAKLEEFIEAIHYSSRYVIIAAFPVYEGVEADAGFLLCLDYLAKQCKVSIVPAR